jgi:uncharacterized membrane protein
MSAATSSTAARRTPALLYLLPMVMLLFIGILVFVYCVTKRTSVVMLDETGRPVGAASQAQHH